MNKLYILIAIAVVGWFWQSGSFPGSGGAESVDANGNPIVNVFTFKNCGVHCNNVTKMLKKRRVPFEELEVNQSEKDSSNTKLWKKMGKGGFPYIVSGKSKVAGYSKSQIVSLLGNNYGDEYLTKSEKRYFSKHFYDDGTPKIVMYGAEWCGYCKRLKEEFRSEGVDYIEIDVEKSGEQKKISRVMGISGYPSTWVGYSRVIGSTLRDIEKVQNKG